MTENPPQKPDYPELSRQIKAWAVEAGFAEARITRASLPAEAEQRLAAWLAAGFHGEMEYMERHGALRLRPAELVPGTLSVISLRMNYWPAARAAEQVLADPSRAYLSRYALGRDYHKVLRNRLQKLAERIEAAAGAFGYRVFTDSAPLAEVALASQAGLGWRGKHTLLLTKRQGSLFFLGEILTDLPLPADDAEDGHCGRCRKCLDVCPTGAIVEPYSVDARRCISYLTIELKAAIPQALRPLIGNRVYGCDDCQLFCPWNRFAVQTAETDFAVRHGLDDVSLVELFGWSADDFRERMAGSPIYRIGYHKWLSNLAVGLGNAPSSAEVIAALRRRLDFPDELVAEPVRWALARHGESC
ncbi:tRNA epoxyqueuosine(34) reductase QueG [Chromobacterium subtsugae]|uniref:Epoxyqueuosine reductase n=1 Tax=Chromobacterium subtsugae TaxID=251747 RepID=A0ABS7FGJ0_9NEIS|nr:MULTISPECIES: tRNA epoxyqueuosine(34) reductase QueG [Chromobacterium]KUM00015.1 epoxyqueuosine reductase [Chromobacterium subtsugae]KZE86313.1 epoxyqueuosine reductase [Chromobacterium sp. F49]MBW7567935.1 tRNA epoxyqueuosine(34) reductase QueG [Chromobacterium subtsugae]MBW8289162.1 tRNA epoxyqueuosine(34) reductase QueG [Chromobacterium subtsugae]